MSYVLRSGKRKLPESPNGTDIPNSEYRGRSEDYQLYLIILLSGFHPLSLIRLGSERISMGFVYIRIAIGR